MNYLLSCITPTLGLPEPSRMNSKQIPIFLKPLTIAEWEPDFPSSKSSQEPESILFLTSLCSLDTFSDISSCKQRYLELSKFDQDLFVSVEETEIKKNLFDPLHQAKTNYTLGNYVGSIALSGIVAEKLAILIYIMSKPSPEKLERFNEKYHQEKRVNVLRSSNLIGEDSVRDFCFIREARRSSLHHWRSPGELVAERAAQAHAAATPLVGAATNFDIVNGSLTMNPTLWKYLEDKGVIATAG